ncbi:NPC intracellular cholesterol transporter 2-like [Battus philenor]|uniref:NPC intracellular cholesterol transporter 2-like n=1 Tax=Battus philenor TaxID=42288 RepID=UPI0035D0861D
MLLLYFIQYFFVTVKSSVIFQDCGSAYELHRVSIRGCGMRLPCYITLGENVPVTIIFYSDFESLKLDQYVILNINFIFTKPHVTPDPCATVHCPVRSDAMKSFTSIMTVPRNIALNQRGFLQWRVYNDRNQLVLCYSVLVQTQSPMQKFLRSLKIKSFNNIHFEELYKIVGNKTDIEPVKRYNIKKNHELHYKGRSGQ